MIVYLILFLDPSPFLIRQVVLRHLFLVHDWMDIHSVHLTMGQSDLQVLSLGFINTLHIHSSFYHHVTVFVQIDFLFQIDFYSELIQGVQIIFGSN